MIFILIVEVLTQMFLKAQSFVVIIGFKVSTNRGGFPIPQFVDDTLILVDGSLKKEKK